MSRFRIYGSGGRPVYDSAGEPPDHRLDRIKREFNAGVAMFCDPDAGLIRGQVTIHRRSPEQFVATYEADGDEDLLGALVDNVRRAADRREWTIQHGIGGTQALFDAVADGSAYEAEQRSAVERDLAERSLDSADVRAAVEDLGAVDLLVPDYETAAATLGYLRETFPEYAVAVTESTDVETIADADVFVRPSRDADGVSPGPEFASWLDRHRVEAAADALSTSTESLAERVESASDPDAPGVSEALVGVFDRSDPAAALGCRVVDDTESDVGRAAFRRTLSAALPGAVLFGLLSGAFWPGVVPLTPERWPIHLFGLAAGLVWSGIVLSVRTGSDGDDRAPDRERTGLPDAAVSDAERAIEALSTLAATDEAAAREALSTALASYGVAIEPTADRQRRHNRAVVAATALSVAAGAVVLVGVIVTAPALLPAT